MFRTFAVELEVTSIPFLECVLERNFYLNIFERFASTPEKTVSTLSLKKIVKN